MRRFSIAKAIGDGFELVMRRPASTFVWGLLMLAPAFGSIGLMLPFMSEMFAHMPPHASGPEADSAFTDAMFGNMVQVQLGSQLLNIGQYVMMAVVYAAIFRAVVRPREKSFFSLRLGMDELRVAVIGLAIGVGLYAFMIVAMLICFALGFMLWGQGVTVALSTVGIVAALMLLALFWILARVSLLPPACVLYRDFAFSQGWNLAKGRGWPLLGMMILITLMIIAIQVVIVVLGVLIFAGGFAAFGALWDPANLPDNPFIGLDAWIAANWYWAVLAGAAMSLIYGVVMVLGTAPYASACKQLADSGRPADEESSSPADAG